MKEQRIQELDIIENELSKKLIPATGKADTIGGELLRAIERMIYRYYNDGDIVSQGYGIETCLSSYWYLEDTLNKLGVIHVEQNNLGTTLWSKPECDPMAATLEEMEYDYSENDKYKDALYHLLEVVVNFINTDPRAKEANNDDSRTYRNDEVNEIARQWEREEYDEYDEED